MVFISVPWLLWSGWRYLKLELRDLDVNMDSEYKSEEIIIFLYKVLLFANAMGVLR
jgi:hypothetical protein